MIEKLTKDDRHGANQAMQSNRYKIITKYTVKRFSCFLIESIYTENRRKSENVVNEVIKCPKMPNCEALSQKYPFFRFPKHFKTLDFFIACKKSIYFIRFSVFTLNRPTVMTWSPLLSSNRKVIVQTFVGPLLRL